MWPYQSDFLNVSPGQMEDDQKARNSSGVVYEVKRGKGQEGTITSIYEDLQSLCPSHILKLTG